MTAQPNLFTRDDTMFGVCQGLGEDLGFNPDYLRVALPLFLFLYPVPTIAGYAVMGLVVLTVRTLMPAKRATRSHETDETSAVAVETTATNEPLPLAA